MEKLTNKQIVKYSPTSPSVIFHRLRAGLNEKWDQNKMVRSIRQWFRPPQKQAPIKKPGIPKQKTSGLIIPDALDPFMLLAKNDSMSSLMAENQRLRNLINDLVRDDRRSKTPEFRH